MLIDTMAQGDWDAVIAAFSESHCVGHQCRHLHEPSHERHDAALAARIGDPVRDVYVAIDAALGELIEAAGPDADVFVLGSHGMRSHYDATFMLDAILKRIERPGTSVPSVKTASRARRLWGRTPPIVRRMLAPLKGPAKERLGMGELAGRRFFTVPNNDAYGAIRINLVGREPGGRVQPGDEFEQVCAMLDADLRALVNLDTGAPAVRRVLRTQELYRGPLVDHLPDLMVEWNHQSPISRVHSEKTGEITGQYTKCRTGDHSPHGIFAATGPAVVPGPVKEPVSVVDFGPTIADRLGMTLPDVDGRSFAGNAFTRSRT
jgi:predicted AlkP superfamily phosphohydrolase/phosphomutase